MNVRKSTMEDLPEIMETYAYARKLMRENGNQTQWGETEPPEKKVVNDIKNGWGYVIEENGTICGAFAFIIGRDPMYLVIKDGDWLNDTDPYGTIHRLGTNGKARGVFDACLDFCKKAEINQSAETVLTLKFRKHRSDMLREYIFSLPMSRNRNDQAGIQHSADQC